MNTLHSSNGKRVTTCSSAHAFRLVLACFQKREVVISRYVKSARKVFEGDKSLIPTSFIDKLEDIVHGFLGILLFMIAVLAALFSLQRLIETRPFFPTGMIQGINDILLVVIILEIMRTVVVRFTDGIFQLDSFLIIGVIAAVRHILTVGAALTMEKDKLGEAFNRSLYEMGVNTGIVLALVFALFLSRSARKSKS
jgi:uncharacterized membrane protein (DUF373 family)